MPTAEGRGRTPVSRSALCVLLSALLVPVIAAPIAAQPRGSVAIPEGTSQIPYEQRTDAFRRLLFELQFQPINDFAALQANPRQSLLIVLGQTDCLGTGNFPEGLVPFVRAGGAVLVAADREVRDETARKNLVKLSGVMVTGQTLVNHVPDHFYESPYCPFVEPIPENEFLGRPTSVLGALARSVGAGGRPDLFRSARPDQPDLKVATNAPSRLEVRGWWGLPGGIQRLARLPDGCREELYAVFPMRRRPPVPRPLPAEDLLFAVGGPVGEGRVLVLADHSIFINRMILPGNTGNLEFTANCLHWLRGGASTPMDAIRAAQDPNALRQLIGERDKALFVDDGRIQTDFRVPMREVPPKLSLGSEPAIVAAIDRTLTKMEDNDAFNGKLLEWLDWDLPDGRRSAIRFAVYLVTLAAGVLLAHRFLWRGRHRLDAAVPLLGPAVAHHEPKAPLLEQRRRALLRSGNVWETVHQLARESFESAGIPLATATPPRVAVRGGWWQRRRVARRVARLWEVARGTVPARIPPAALRHWLRDLDEMKSALADGTIQLT